MSTATLESMPSFAVEKYLDELGLLRKERTVESARQILEEYLTFADPHDIRGGVLRWLSWCKNKGNTQHTLEAKRLRVAAFYKRLDVNLHIPRIRYAENRPEIYTPAQLDLIFSAARGRRFWLYKSFLQSGLRSQEMQNLEYGNLLDGGIQVTQHGRWTPKDHQERVVLVPKALTDSLRRLPKIILFPIITCGSLRTDVRFYCNGRAHRFGYRDSRNRRHGSFWRSVVAQIALARGCRSSRSRQYHRVSGRDGPNRATRHKT